MRKIIVLAIFFLINSWANAQHASGDNTTDAEFDAILKSPDRTTRDIPTFPPLFSIKKYTPIPLSQDPYQTCVAWSSTYAARTISYAIKRNITNPDSINKIAFSPEYVYYKVKQPTDADCSAGGNILSAMQVMTSNGAMLKKEGIENCVTTIPETTESQKAGPYKIKTFMMVNKKKGTIEKNDINTIKRKLIENNPVVISLNIDDAFQTVPKSGIWSPETGFASNNYHAMCIIGYNDKMAGGAFEVMNSWGTKWGDNGFFWLTYKQLMEHGSYAVEMMDYEVGKTELNGNIEFIKWEDGIEVPLKKVTRVKIDTSTTIVKTVAKPNFSLYKLTQALKSGDNFKIKFRTNAPCFIYILGKDALGKIDLLFPVNTSFSAAINSPNATFYLPSDSTNARLDKNVGKETFCILYSKDSIDYEGLKKYIAGKNIFRAIKDKLGARLLDMNKILFRDDSINFKAPAEEKSVLCFFVEMNHN